MRTLRVLVLLACLLTLPAATADAQPMGACQIGAVTQHDMQGVYVSPEWQIRVEIYPCSGSFVRWTNEYGTHFAAYSAIGRVPSGGIVAQAIPDASSAWLDNVSRIGYKPAEPGYLQVFTLGIYDATYRVYRLQKIG